MQTKVKISNPLNSIKEKFFYLKQKKNSSESEHSLRNSSRRHRRLESEFTKPQQIFSNRHRRNTNSNTPAPPPAGDKPCPKNKPIFKKAFNRCSSATNTCVVQCSKNHQFANGKDNAKLVCKDDAWMLEGFEKSDRPVCERKYSHLNVHKKSAKILK